MFPTVDGHVVAGPTAIDLTDKRDRSVRPEALAEIRAKVDAMLPGLRRAGARLRRAAPRRARRQLRDRPLAGLPARWSTSRRSARPACRASLGIAEHVAGLLGPADATGGAAAEPSPPWRAGQWWRVILGVDEGTTAVKAVLYDDELRPAREARRRKQSRHPQPGWVEQDGEEILDAVVDAIAELLARRAGRGQPPAASTTRASRCSPGTPRPAQPLSPVVVWQDKRTQAILDRLAPDAEEITRAQRPAARPLLLLLASSRGCSRTCQRSRAARERRHAAAGQRRRLADRPARRPASPPTPRPPRARSCTASATPAGTRGCASASACRREALPEVRDSVGALGTLRHERWPQELPLTARVVDQQAALAGAGCVVAGRVKATYGTGVFVLAHVGDEVPAAVRRPAADRRLAGRRRDRVRARRRRVRGRRDARVDVPRARPRARAGRRSARSAGGVPDSGGARVLPGHHRRRRAVVAARTRAARSPA